MLSFLLDIHLIDGRRDPEHLAIRVDENVGLVSHLVVTISTATQSNMLVGGLLTEFLTIRTFYQSRGGEGIIILRWGFYFLKIKPLVWRDFISSERRSSYFLQT